MRLKNHINTLIRIYYETKIRQLHIYFIYSPSLPPQTMIPFLFSVCKRLRI